MAFQAYYDGSGGRDLAAITLSGVAASEHIWQQFKPLWQNALDENGVPDRLFSMTDLMSGNKRFRSGWDRLRRRKLLTDLFNVFGKSKPLGMSAYSCTVFFDAYDKAKSELPGLRRPEAICVNHCVGTLQLTEEQRASEPQPIILYFDRNEAFLRTVDQVWRKGRKKRSGWPMQVRDIIPVDSSCYPIQAADLLAWTVYRWHRQAAERGEIQPKWTVSFTNPLNEYDELVFTALLMIHPHMRCYDDYRQIIEQYPDG